MPTMWIILVVFLSTVSQKNVFAIVCGQSLYVVAKDSKFDITAFKLVPDASFTDCQGFCTTNSLANNSPLECCSYQYNSATSACQLFTGCPDSSVLLAKVNGTNIYRKICKRDEAGDSCVSHFNWYPQTLRTGHAKLSLKAQTLTLCLNFCINSLTRYNFTCLSVMYYYDLEQCVLHTDNSETNSAVKSALQPATIEQQVDYFEASCHSNGDWSNWSDWTVCSRLDSHHIRNRTCLTSTACKGSDRSFKSCA